MNIDGATTFMIDGTPRRFIDLVYETARKNVER